MIIVRITLTVAKTAFAGVILEIFSARSMASMAAFNKETAFSRPFGRWELVVMVETEGSHKGTVRGAAVRSLLEMGVNPVIVRLVRSDVFGELWAWPYSADHQNLSFLLRLSFETR